jgi:hypothetical protein
VTQPADNPRQRHDEYRVWLIEKLIINFAMPMDFVYHTFRATFQKDTSQTTKERLLGLWYGKIAKYQKLLRVRDELGEIPQDWQELCMQTPCGKTRLFLAKWANVKRRRPKNYKPPVVAPAAIAQPAATPEPLEAVASNA